MDTGLVLLMASGILALATLLLPIIAIVIIEAVHAVTNPRKHPLARAFALSSVISLLLALAGVALLILSQ